MPLITPAMQKSYPTATQADGTVITTSDGRKFFDGSSGAIACTLGHNHPHITSAIVEQLARVQFVYRAQFSNEPAKRLADRLCEKLGYTAAFFVNSGSEAVETAVRLAQQYWREVKRPEKTKVLSRRVSYHGSTIGTLSLSGHWPRRRAAGNILVGEPSLPTPYCFRCPLGELRSSCRLACAKAVEEHILAHGADSVAALVLEPIVGASGAAIVPPAGYLETVREICDRHEVILIADEVLTGLGRTGRWLATDHASVRADIVCLGKGLNGGYLPISGVLANARIYDALLAGSASFHLRHTHSNHPIAAAAANAVLDVLEEESLIERAAALEDWMEERLRSVASRHSIIGDLRGRGMFWGLEIVQNAADDPFPAEMGAADCVVRHAFNSGLIIYPAAGFVSGASGDAVILAPPLNTSLNDLEHMIELLGAALATAEQELLSEMEKTHVTSQA